MQYERMEHHVTQKTNTSCTRTSGDNYTSTRIISCCKCMKNNAFRQTNVTFFEAQNTHLAPNKSTPTRGASAWWERSERNVAALLHSEAEGCREGVEGLHQAVEGVDTVGKAQDAGGTTDEEAARGVGGAIAGMDENAGTAWNALQTRQACAPHFRPRTGERRKRGEGTSRRRSYSPAGMAGCAPDIGGSRVATERRPTSVGNKRMPSVPPGRIAVRQRRSNEDMGL